MKGINKFFYRIDVIKNTYFFISIPIMLACWFYPVGMWLFVLLPISTIGLVLGLLKLPIPKEEAIVKETFSIHEEYENKVRRQIGNNIGEVYVLGGFSKYRAAFARRIGSRTIYPMCRTLVFVKTEDHLEIYMKDSPLMEGLAPQEQCFKLTSSVNLNFENQNKEFLLSFMIDKDQVEIISSDKHKLREILSNYNKYFQYDESLMK